MDIQKLNTGTPIQRPAQPKAEIPKKEVAENKTDNLNEAVVVEKEKEDNKEVKKDDYKVDQKALDKLFKEHEQKTKQFLNLVNSLFSKQADKSQMAKYKTFDQFAGDIENFKEKLQESISNGEIDQATIDQAKKDVAEDGYYGVEKTSDRLVDFAKAISGGDPEKIELLRDAVLEGFKMAAEAWGDELPQISKDTYNATMDKFDAWAEESGITLPERQKLD